MKKIPIFFAVLLIINAGFAQRQTGNATLQPRDTKSTNRSSTGASGVASLLSQPKPSTDTRSDTCQKDAITEMFNAFCSNNVCNDSDVMFNVITSSGVATSNASCKAIVYEEISARLSYNYKTFKSECDLMNKRYVDSINEWTSKYSELSGAKSKAEKGKKTATAVAIGTSAVAVGSGIYNIIQHKEKKDLKNINKKLQEEDSVEFQKKSKECQDKAKEGELWVYDSVITDCKFHDCKAGYKKNTTTTPPTCDKENSAQ